MDYCLLPADVNECQYFNPEGEGMCHGGPEECTFFRQEEEDTFRRPYKYVRELRWYEKYYKQLK